MSESLTITLDREQQETLGDALGFLFTKAPARRAEIEDLARATGLSVCVDV